MFFVSTSLMQNPNKLMAYWFIINTCTLINELSLTWAESCDIVSED